MSIRDTTMGYGVLTRILHWVTAALIIGQLLLGVCLDDVSTSQGRYIAYTLHKSFGILILFVALVYMIWRWVNVKPAWPGTMLLWERLSAQAVHYMLYWLLVLMPLSGWIMATAAKKPPYFFFLIKVPLPFIPHHRVLAQTFGHMHSVLAYILAGAIVIHVLAAFKHLLINKDQIMRRMLKGK